MWITNLLIAGKHILYIHNQIDMDLLQKERQEWEAKHPNKDFDEYINNREEQ